MYLNRSTYLVTVRVHTKIVSVTSPVYRRNYCTVRTRRHRQKKKTKQSKSKNKKRKKERKGKITGL